MAFVLWVGWPDVEMVDIRTLALRRIDQLRSFSGDRPLRRRAVAV
jgi:hypothetical protein